MLEGDATVKLLIVPVGIEIRIEMKRNNNMNTFNRTSRN